MRDLSLRLLVIFASLLMALPVPSYAQNYIQSFENGKIDWSNEIAEAVGIGTPPAKPINLAQARALAKRAAVASARKNLFEIITRIQIDSKILIKDLVAKSDTTRKELQVLLRNAQVVDISYKQDRRVKATVAMKFTGSLSELVLPKSILTIKPVKQPRPPSQNVKEGFTGLVVDCRGSKVRPAMVIRIIDEDGEEVYGSAFVSRDHAVQKGMAGYAKDLAAAEASPRVATRPLTVEGIRPAETGHSDILISNADAAKIRGAASNLSFLQKCRVTIVLD